MDAGERLARLEQRADNSDDDRDEMAQKVDQIAADVHEIKEKLSNWRGVFSGVVLTIGMLSGLIGAGITALWHRLTG